MGASGGMLRMIVCDWNGTLFRPALDGTYFIGLCRRAFFRAVWRGDVRKAARLTATGVRCFGRYCAAKARPDHAVRHVARVVELLNPDVFSGLRREELAAYTRRYARAIGPRLDRRLLAPIARAVARTGIETAVISAAYHGAIEAALDEAGQPFDRVLANDFHMDGEATARFELAVGENKAELLAGLLAERGLDADEVMYVGDSPPDETCMRAVGLPVVSFYATRAHKRRFAETCGAFVPASSEEFERHVLAAADA